MNAGHLSRAGELAAVRGELVRTDGKCGTLAALAGAGAAFAAGQAGHGPLAARAAFALAGLALTGAVLVVLLALRPRLGSVGFCRWAAMSESDVRLLTWQEDTDRIGGLPAVRAARTAAGAEAETLHTLSVITMVKYRRLRLASDLAAAGVVLLAAAAVAGVIA